MRNDVIELAAIELAASDRSTLDRVHERLLAWIPIADPKLLRLLYRREQGGFICVRCGDPASDGTGIPSMGCVVRHSGGPPGIDDLLALPPAPDESWYALCARCHTTLTPTEVAGLGAFVAELVAILCQPSWTGL